MIDPAPSPSPAAAAFEVIRAPARRVIWRKLGLMLGASVLVVVVGKRWFFPWLNHYLDPSLARVEGLRRFKLFMLWWGSSVFAGGLYLGYLGARVLREGQFPLVGTFVVRDTPIRRGLRVRVRGVAMLAFAAVLCVSAVAMALMPWRLDHP